MIGRERPICALAASQMQLLHEFLHFRRVANAIPHRVQRHGHKIRIVLGSRLVNDHRGERLWNGGRDRTRTCDLLRVKPAPCFFWLQGITSVLWFFNNMGSLLFAQLQVPWFEMLPF